MTIGNKTSDSTVQANTSCGSVWTGTRITRVWNGVDDPQKTRENPYTATHTSTANPLISWSLLGGPWKWGTVPGCGFRASAVPIITASQKDLVKTRCLSRLLGKYKLHDFNAAIFIGELPETVKMVSEPLIDTLRAYRYVRRGRFDKAVKVFKTRDPLFRVDRHASNAWLSLRYGWIPALSDSYEAAKAYHVLQTQEVKKSIKVRSSAKLLLTRDDEYCSVVEEYGVAVILKTDFFPSIASSLGFGDPMLLAWELLPFSFVLDWAYDVGTWLELVSALPVRGATQYITTTRMKRIETGPWRNGAWYSFRPLGPSFRDKKVDINRSISNAAGVPPPRWKNPLNGKVNRVLDMVALARAIT